MFNKAFNKNKIKNLDWDLKILYLFQLEVQLDLQYMNMRDVKINVN